VYSQEDTLESNVTVATPIWRPPTARKDIRALLAIKRALRLTGLTGWNRSSDPCNAFSGWSHVACTCDPFNASFASSERIHCDNYRTRRNISRVIFVRIEGTRTEENSPRRSIPHQVGHLQKLRWLSLDDNDLEGDIPDSFRNLRHLRYLSLAQNRLSGTIPEFFNSYQALMTLHLHHNNFSGELPATLCSPDTNGTNNSTNRSITASAHHNYFMCGEHLYHLLNLTENRNGTGMFEIHN